MNEDNPYRPSVEADTGSGAAQVGEPGTGRRIAAWILIFLFNLPVPTFLGLYLVETPGGYLGMTAGCLLWCACGIALCFGPRAAHVRATTLGGVLVALSQFYPLLQMYAGLLAILLISPLLDIASDQIGHKNLDTGMPLLDATYSGMLTLTTGAVLISAAWLTGHLLTFMMRPLRRKH